MSSLLVEIPADPRICRHEGIEELGHDGDAIFYRCTGCGSIMIVQHGHRWIIRPTDTGGPLSF
ncbi:MAG TPA: hypothetical protein VEY12_02170 [Thermoplasmata archaeon]|nr:hypothetical protein [Thermoplasmata archaeon]